MSRPQEWNPNQANQDTDDQYAANGARSGGWQEGALVPSTTLNKVLNQLSRWIVAISSALVSKGINIDDSSTPNLTGQLAQLVVNSDLIPYALLNSPVFTGTPQAPTPTVGDNSKRIATTAFVAGLSSFAVNGYTKLPSGLIVQWGQANGIFDGATVVFPLVFPHAAFVVLAQGIGGSVNIAGGLSPTSFRINTSVGSAYWIAIGY